MVGEFAETEVEAKPPAPGGEDGELPPAPGGEDDTDQQCKGYLASVSDWLVAKAEAAVQDGKSLVQLMEDTFPMSPDLRAQVLQKVPWPSPNGYVAFLRRPGNKTKGHVHISMLNFGENRLHCNGMYAGDAAL